MDEVLYRLPIKDSIRTAWHKVHGAKASLLAALLIFLIVMLVIGIMDGYLTRHFTRIETFFAIIGQVLLYLLQIGLMYMGVRRAQDLPIDYKLVFRGFEGHIVLKAIGLYILQFLILLIPILLIIASLLLVPNNASNHAGTTPNGPTMSMTTTSPSSYASIVFLILCVIGIIAIIYLSLRISLSIAFVVDKAIGPWKAIKLSFKATRSNLWRLIGIYILQALIFLVSIIPIGIGLIWSIPFSVILYGVIYKNLSPNAGSPSPS